MLSAWIGLVELVLWGVAWFFILEKWYPRFNNWALNYIDEERELRERRSTN